MNWLICVLWLVNAAIYVATGLGYLLPHPADPWLPATMAVLLAGYAFGRAVEDWS